MDSVLISLLDSLESTSTSIAGLSRFLDDVDTSNGMSLLTLKNEALLAYVHECLLVLLAQLDHKQKDKKAQEEIDEENSLFSKAVKSTVVNRTVLDRGVKGLESKIAYEIEKALRNYQKYKAQQEEKKKNKGSDDEDEDSEDEEDEDEMAFKPNPFGLSTSKSSNKNSKNSTYESEDESDESDEDESKSRKKSRKAVDDEDDGLYKAPKISATLPENFDEKVKRSSMYSRKNALLEDFISSTSAAPQLESSIGSTIIDGGRGGHKTLREFRKEREIDDYEESNYTRLPEKIKENYKGGPPKKGRRNRFDDSILGNDWKFDNDNTERDSKKRKKSSKGNSKKRSRR